MTDKKRNGSINGLRDKRPMIDALIKNYVPIKDSDGHTVIDIGIIATFYLEKGWDKDVKAAVSKCFEHYQSIFGTLLRWANNTQKKGWVRTNSRQMMSPADLFALESIHENTPWEFHYHGGDFSEDASQYSIHGMGRPQWEKDDISYLSITVPRDWFLEHRKYFIQLVLDWCEQLEPLHGYAGLGLVESPSYAIVNRHATQAIGLARRFIGLELDYPYFHVIYLKNGLKGINWLTIIGNDFFSQKKDSDSILKNVRDVLKTYNFSKGLVIQAAELPTTGDINKNLFPENYKEVNKILRPWRISRHCRFHDLSGFDQAASEAWLARFD